MKKSLLYIAAFMASGATVRAQEEWDLRQCIDYAIEHNIQIRKAANAVEQSDVDVNTSKWARLPDLNGSVGQNWSWGRAEVEKFTNDEKQTSYKVYETINASSTSFSLSTNVPLFTGFQLPNQYALAKLNLKAAVADLEKAKEDVAINVASAYLQVLFNLELSKVAAGQVTLSKEQLARLNRLYELGKTSPAEVAEAKARAAQDEMSATQADNSYRLSLLDLSQLLELPTPENFSIVPEDTTLTFGPLTPPDEIYMTALTYKPVIQAAELRLEGSEKNVKIAQSGYYPQLSLWANMSSRYLTPNPYDFSKQMKDNFGQSLGFNLSVPLFNRFSTRNRVRSAKLQQLNMAFDLDQTKKTLYKEIQQAWYNAVAAESKYNSSVVAVEANEESFHLMKEKFENGKAIPTEYNESKQALMRALSDKIQAKYEYLFRTKILDFYKGIPID